MDAWPLFAAGVTLMAVVMLDVVWTVLAGADGRGPLTAMVARAAWRVATRRGPRTGHRTLQLTGYGILIGLLLLWVLQLWGGLTLCFLADADAVVSASTQQPASALARAGYALGGLAGAGAAYTAGSGGWVLLNNAAAVIGLGFATLTLTYLFQVVNAAAQKRALALHVIGIGATPAALAAVGVGKQQLGALGDHLTSVAQQVALLARYHLALPVLSYLHVGRRTAAIEVAVAVLDEALTIVEAVPDDDHHGVTAPIRHAITEYLETVHMPRTVAQPPPPPDVTALGGHSSDLVDPVRFEQVLRRHADRRAQLRALVEQNGWTWEHAVDPGS